MKHELASAAAIAATITFFASGTRAQQPGDFDYYVLALSWNASFCAQEGSSKGYDQCDGIDDPAGLVLHGLWPQYQDGDWPDYCQSGARNPSRQETAAQADLFGAAGSAWHQWKKHGTCTGLTSAQYYDDAARAFDSIVTPPVLLQAEDPLTVDVDVLEEAILESNPQLDETGVVMACREEVWREVRICLDKDLSPRPCGEINACRGAVTLLPSD